jgi:outer membrane lipoprotein-sorting protein
MVPFRSYMAFSQKIRLLPLLLIAWFSCLPSVVLAADTNDVLNSWFAAQASLQSWSADFIQTRTLKTLTQPLVTTGHVWFRAPDAFHWEIGQPARTIALGQGDAMYVIYPRLKRAERYPMGKNTPQQWRDMMSLLQAGLPRNRQDFDGAFRVQSMVQTNAQWLIVLQPRSEFTRQMMPELDLNLATNDLSLTATELVFVDGSRMRSDYTHAVVNGAVDKNLFEWTPPGDFKVTSPLSQ